MSALAPLFPGDEIPVVSCVSGTNAELFAAALQLHLPAGSRVADVTYGGGVFWQKVPHGQYDVLASDLMTGVDFRSLPYGDESLDALVLDPPYKATSGGDTDQRHASLERCYKTSSTDDMTHAGVMALYLGALIEARRVVRKNGLVFVKCQAQADHGQHLFHVDITNALPMLGFRVIDEFVLHQRNIPMMRNDTQRVARKNHSYLLVAERVRR